ncbi:MAG: hypothetical protein V4486_03915 [Patescibacteria group bacterium]
MYKKGSASSVLISIVIIILVIFGIYYWVTHTTSTTVVNNYTTTTPTPGATVNPGVPAASTENASFISASGAVLNGEVSPNGVQTSYWYEYGTTQALGSNSSAQLVGGGYVTFKAPAAIGGLKPSTLYYYRLSAQNQFGKVMGETSTFTTTATATTPQVNYSSPVSQTRDATVITSSSVTLNGTVNPNGSATFYWFEYGDSFSLGNTTAVSSAGGGNVSVSASAALSGLTPEKTYYYRLNAQNAYGTTNGNISVFMTQPTNPPAQPANVPNAVTGSATSVTSTSAALNGQVDPNGVATNYHFEYGKSTLFGLFTLEQRTDDRAAGTGTALAPVTRSITGLDNNSTYYYRLVAENSQGKTFGAIFSFTTKK